MFSPYNVKSLFSRLVGKPFVFPGYIASCNHFNKFLLLSVICFGLCSPFMVKRCHGWCSCRLFLRREWKVVVTQRTHAYFFKGFEKQTLWNLEGRRFIDFFFKTPIKKIVAFCTSVLTWSIRVYIKILFNYSISAVISSWLALNSKFI